MLASVSIIDWSKQPALGARLRRAASIVVGYGVLFVVLEMAAGGSAWHPTAGLHLALLTLFGLAYLPTVFIAMIAGGFVFSDLGLAHLVLPALIAMLGNGMGAAVLRHRLRGRSFFTPRAATLFVMTALTVAVGVALLSSVSLISTGTTGYSWPVLADIVLNAWLLDAVGLLTLTPLLLLVALPHVQHAPFSTADSEFVWPPAQARPWLELAGQLAAIALALFLAFAAPSTGDVFYLCFLPLLWMALRNGLARVALGVLLINLGVVLLHGRSTEMRLIEIQLFMIALALTGVFLGALVSERKRALQALQDALASQPKSEAIHNQEATAKPKLTERPQETMQLYVAALQSSRDRAAATIAQQMSLNEKLTEAARSLEEENASKDRFFSIISHDLKNLLISSIGYAEILASEGDTLPRETVREFATTIHSACRHTYDLLGNLLTWARMQTGHMPFAPEKHDAYLLAQRTVRLVDTSAMHKQIILENRIPHGTTVYADPTMVGSVLQNLLTNALKFTEAGGKVTVSACSLGDQVELAVTDTGVGIPQSDLPMLFEGLAGRSSPGTNGETGTGLGLRLSKEMVERHGSELRVESRLGWGTTFRFMLPTHPVNDEVRKSQTAVP